MAPFLFWSGRFCAKLAFFGLRAMEPAMPYFDESQDRESRIGKVVGDIIAALIYLSLIALALNIIVRVV
jgi:hypothetical protein